MHKHASTLLAKDIIDIVNWLRDYHGQLEGLEATVQPVLTDDMGSLLQVCCVFFPLQHTQLQLGGPYTDCSS